MLTLTNPNPNSNNIVGSYDTSVDKNTVLKNYKVSNKTS